LSSDYGLVNWLIGSLVNSLIGSADDGILLLLVGGGLGGCRVHGEVNVITLDKYYFQ
jgi:hypothetical protein